MKIKAKGKKDLVATSFLTAIHTLGNEGGSQCFQKPAGSSLEAPPSFNHQFDRGEIESILNGLEPALGLGLLGIRPPGRN